MTWRPPVGVLGELTAAARKDSANRRRARPGLPGEVFRQRRSSGAFCSALRHPPPGIFPLICEVKRASPSAGTIRAGAVVADLARAYATAGARCISVLTEGHRFGGSLDDLREARGATVLPLLRKDFVVDSYMVHEAADAGADCVLLIAAAVEPAELMDLASAAEEGGLDVLLELIFERDLDALGLRDWSLVGINARDLETLEVDGRRFERLAPRARSAGRLIVAESGMQTPDDIARAQALGADAALIGEALMRSDDPAGLIRRLLHPVSQKT